MSRLLPFTLVNKNQLDLLVRKTADQESEISSATAFIKQIEEGNLNISDIENVNANSLTGTLLAMQNKMKRIAEEERERNWATEGLAKFSEILRSNSKDMEKLSNQIITELVRYMDANQGGLYLINDTNKSDVHIQLNACYAYNRKKYFNQRFELGEGIIGQAALEKGTIYMTNIPSNYIKITSGLGEALPRNLIIVPLKLEDQVYGMVELASFKEIKKYQIDFLEKLSATLASTIASVRTAEMTQSLLKESQIQTEQLRASEEEVRQNMEELKATQDEMQRILNEVQRSEKQINELLNVSSDSIVTIDYESKVILFNHTFANSFKNFQIQKGFNTLELYSYEERIEKKNIHERVFKGEAAETLDHITIGGHDKYFKVKYAPLFDLKGKAASIAVFATDVTEIARAKEKAEGLAKDAQEKNEELKAQEEELRQNLEELKATQDEMERILNQVQKNEQEITELINASGDSILTIDRDFRLVRANKAVLETLKGLDITKGFQILSLFSKNEQLAKIEIYNKVFAGQELEIIDHSTVTGRETYHKVRHTPLFGVDGTVNSIAIFATDITDLHKAKEQAQQMEKGISDLLNVSTDSVLTIDRDYKVLRFNKAFQNSFGDLRIQGGFDIFSLFSDEAEIKRKRELYDQAFQGKVVESIDHFRVGTNNIYFKVTHSPIFDTTGSVRSIAIYANDITAIHQAKHRAEAQEKELNQLLNVSDDSILIIDRSLKVLRFNAKFAETIPTKVNEGFDLMQIFPEETHHEKKKLFERTFNGETIELVEHSRITGSDLYVKVIQKPLYDSLGKIPAIAIYANDITEVYVAKREAEKLAKEAQAQNEELRAQEEEIRQNMEELQSIQEELNRKNKEMEKVRQIERHTSEQLIQTHKNVAQNMIQKFRHLEAQYKRRIAELERKADIMIPTDSKQTKNGTI